MIGYSFRLRELNRKADKTSLGVRLGKHCISTNIPVIEIGKLLGVSRQTVYNWFTGVHVPEKRYESEIQRILSS